VLLDGDRAAAALWVATGISSLQVFVPDLLTRPNLLEIAYNARERSDTVDLAYGAMLSDLCHRVAPNRKAVDDAISNRMPEYRSNVFRDIAGSCDRWNVPAGSTEFFRPTRSDVPVFMVQGELGADTDISWVDRVAKGCSHATVIAFPSLGYGVFTSAPKCLGDLRSDFLDAPMQRADAAAVLACVESTPPVPFVIS